MVPEWYQGAKRVQSASLSIANAYASYPKATIVDTLRAPAVVGIARAALAELGPEVEPCVIVQSLYESKAALFTDARQDPAHA
jgi:hypothetical protein